MTKRGQACAAMAALFVVYVFVRGLICLETHGFYAQDAWRDIMSPTPGASVLNAIPSGPGGYLPNPPNFEQKGEGTQMSTSQVRRIFDMIKQAGKGQGINLLVFGLGKYTRNPPVAGDFPRPYLTDLRRDYRPRQRVLEQGQRWRLHCVRGGQCRMD